jgi:hypothetical protein
VPCFGVRQEREVPSAGASRAHGAGWVLDGWPWDVFRCAERGLELGVKKLKLVEGAVRRRGEIERRMPTKEKVPGQAQVASSIPEWSAYRTQIASSVGKELALTKDAETSL